MEFAMNGLAAAIMMILLALAGAAGHAGRERIYDNGEPGAARHR